MLARRRPPQWAVSAIGAVLMAGAGLPGEAVQVARDHAAKPPGGDAPPQSGKSGIASGGAIRFDGIDDHVTMGPAPGLGSAAFTLEHWFVLEGPGATARTEHPDAAVGPGVDAYPLISKGRKEGEGDLTDMNYFLGIIPGSDRLVADFEDRELPCVGANEVVTASTTVQQGQWHHAAATYDGETWRLYLNGILDGERRIALQPQYESVQHFALGSAINSLGVPEGAFNGIIDEVRIWDHARSGAEIRASMNEQIDSAPGLIGSWHCDDAASGTLADSSGSGHDGVVIGALPAAGAPLDLPLPPEPAVPLAPADGQTVGGTSVELVAEVGDQDSASVEATIYGRLEPDEAEAFTIVVLPDTQRYVVDYFPAFLEQTQWIIEQRLNLNIACVVHVGDIVNNSWVLGQWDLADQALSILDEQPDLPRALCVGNHDQDPWGDPNGTVAFNTYFPVSRYEAQPWYGGHYGTDNDNHYILFTAQGQDYIVLALEFRVQTIPEELDWANAMLQAHPDRKAILVTHSLILIGEPAEFTQDGEAIFDALKNNENLFLMLSGHVLGEGRRTDVMLDHTIHSLMANFQERHDGGNGWLRIMSFGDGYIRVRMYSPTLDRFERDPDSEFTLGQEAPFVLLATWPDVDSGSVVSHEWVGLLPGRRYSWYVETGDGTSSVGGPVWEFFVAAGCMGDIDGSGDVGVTDFLALLEAWGPNPGHPADLDGNGSVGVTDFLILLAAWGPCP